MRAIQRNRQAVTPRSVVTAIVIVASLLGAPSSLLAQRTDCAASITVSRVGLQAAAAAIATGIEYGSMRHEGAWHMAQEPNRAAVLADPSSHLHGLGSYHMARNLGGMGCLSATSRRLGALRGAGAALALGVAKEVSDGWYNGFSRVDLAVDAMGAGYAVAQAYVPALRHLTPTFSVAPAAFTGAQGMRGALTNYANQTVWLSASVHDMLPTSLAKAWPAPVRVSLGRRAYGHGATSDYVLGLDLDAERLPGSNPVWRRVKHVLHEVRLPGPALVMRADGVRSVGLYW